MISASFKLSVLTLNVAQVEGLLKDINAKEPSQGSTEDLEPSEGGFVDAVLESRDYLHLAPDIGADPFLEAGSGSQDGSHQKESQLIGLGMTEALPPFDIIEDLSVSLHILGTNFIDDVVVTPRFSLRLITWHLSCIQASI